MGDGAASYSILADDFEMEIAPSARRASAA
jgi:hypothetical protein